MRPIRVRRYVDYYPTSIAYTCWFTEALPTHYNEMNGLVHKAELSLPSIKYATNISFCYSFHYIYSWRFLFYLVAFSYGMVMLWQVKLLLTEMLLMKF